ncbi:MAG: WYL domain-containing protein [Eubacterium sp.]|nr:WYL domain-containing protein [Eubacterium sp.]
MDKQSKNFRVLDIYVRLCEGKIINKAEEAAKFGVDARSIQRDIDDIRAFLEERSMNVTDVRKIEYNYLQKGFVMTGIESSIMSNSEILAISKILLGSRAFTKKHMYSIIDKMIAGCVPRKNLKLVSDLIANEKFHYVELRHKTEIGDMLWEMGMEIEEHNLLEITYEKQIDAKEMVKRIIQPVAVLFSEYYFYLNAYIMKKDEKNAYVHAYDYPTIFRLDRIHTYRKTGDKFRVPYADRFEEGEYRKRLQFMFAGKLIRMQFCFTGNSVDAILDRLPTAKVIQEDEGGCVIDAEVYGRGILMWLLSQGTMVEVLKPESFREEMKKTLLEMLAKYD